MKMNGVSTKRFDWVDIAKGIGMLLVILGHCQIGRYRDVIFSFHMPLFFICSGFTLRVSQTAEDFKKNTKRVFLYLMANAFGIFLAETILKIVFVPENRATPGILLSYLLERVFVFIGGSGAEITFGTKTIESVGIVWFLMALFWGRTIFDLLHLKCRKKAVFYVLIGAFSIAGFVLGRIQWLPMSLDIAFIIQPLFLFGHALKKADLKKRLLLVCAGSLTGWMILLVFLGIEGKTIFEFVLRRYPIYPICFVCAILGSMFIVCLSVALSEYLKAASVPLKLLGKHSIVMFWIHGLDLCVPFVKTLFNCTGNDYVNALLRVLVNCSIFAMAMLLIKLFRKVKESQKLKE